MRGKKAKYLRRLAHVICDHPGKGYGTYRTAKNRVIWVPAEDPKTGVTLRDPDTGDAMIMPKRVDGTVQTAWEFRIIYLNLKDMYKRLHGKLTDALLTHRGQRVRTPKKQ
jgi:hypothetical protein